MGLTAAEAFMLIAFALLFLFILWQQENRDEVEKALAFTDLPPEQRQLLLDAAKQGDLERLALLRDEKAGEFAKLPEVQQVRLLDAANQGDLDLLFLLKEDGANIGELLTDGTLEQADRLGRLFDANALDRLSTALQDLPETERLALVDLVSGEANGEILTRLAEIQEYFSLGATLPEIREALTLSAALGEEGLDDVNALKERIRDRIDARGDQQAELAAVLEEELGALVRQVGGEISDDGSITLPNPDGVLFEAGSARITGELRSFLSQTCAPWMRAIQQSGLDISEVRIEGHASSEWNGARSREDAFLRNLGLSQDRAEAVLSTCLSMVRGNDSHRWAQQYLTAVGYSSGRPVLTAENQEDAQRSRRVVFAVDLDGDRFIEEIGREVAEGPATDPDEDQTQGVNPTPSQNRIEGAGGPPETSGNIVGTASVIDGDTIEIHGTRIRLHGIDAPESVQTCEDAHGRLYRCGQQAALSLSDKIARSPVSCTSSGQDRYGREIAVCELDGIDLGAWMVESGYAYAYVRYSKDYVGLEQSARAAGSGFWQGSFQAPWDFR